MGSGCLDTGDGRFQVVQGTSAARTRDVFGLGSTDTSCLQDTEGGFIYFQVADLVAVVVEQDTIAQPVDNQGTHVGGRLDLQVFRFTFLIKLEEYQRVFQSLVHQLMGQCTELTETVVMVALGHDNYFRMQAQTRHYLFVQSEVGSEEEFHLGRMVMQFDELLVVESRIGMFAAVPGTGIHDVADVGSPVFR